MFDVVFILFGAVVLWVVGRQLLNYQDTLKRRRNAALLNTLKGDCDGK